MSSHVARSASAQISALVRGASLPVDSLADDYLEIIAEEISEAFTEASDAEPLVIATASEPEITALLESNLKRRLDEDSSIWRGIVSHVGRGIESINFDGTKLEKRPDLSLTLTAPSHGQRFPLIVEAKIIDCHSGKTAKLYCENGVRRFQVGDYAWGCREAFMLAFVRNEAELIPTLIPDLVIRGVDGAPTYGTLAEPEIREMSGGELATSSHSRSFLYSHQPAPNDMPGPISLWHIWLRTPTASA